MKARKIIGTNYISYPQIRNFVGLPFKNYKIQKTFNVFKPFDFLIYKLFNKTISFFNTSHFSIFNRKIHAFHFFNTISYSPKPWIVTFESWLPYYNAKSKFGLRFLASSRCKKIIAISHNAVKVLSYYLDYTPSFKEKILEKVIVIPPSQKIFKHCEEIKKSVSLVEFTFVGVTFFQKGGKELLLATEALIKKGYKFRLNIVSSFKERGFKEDHLSPDDYKLAFEIIGRYPDLITHYPSLSNEKVIDLLKKSDVAVFPSYGESYGYFVLEAQACGCPVITNNLPPFEEFNNNECGWIYEVPQIFRNGTMTSNVYSPEGLQELQDKQLQELSAIMKDIITHPEIIYKKALKALERINQHHNPDTIAKELEGIYSDI